MPKDRIGYLPLLDKITNPKDAASHIKNGDNVFISGFSAGYPKLVPIEIAKRANAGEEIKINFYAGASTSESVDGLLAEAGVINWRRPYMSSRPMRRMINDGVIHFKDDHLSSLAGQVRAGDWGKVDVAVIEAAAITNKGHLIPTLSVGNTPTYVREAEKIIIEMSCINPIGIEGIHDIFIPEDPPYRMPIPIYRTLDRIGKPFIEMNPDKVVAIVFSSQAESGATFPEPDEISILIAEQILDFVQHEIKAERMPPGLPWQSGVGSVANAVLAGFMDDDFFTDLDVYSEVLQDSVLDLIDMGKVRAASGSAVTLSQRGLERFYNEIYRYKEKIVLRPQEISNSPEIIRRLGVIAVNTAMEFDIYAHVNSTHVCGSQMMNGIGGSGDFERSAALSFMVCPSINKDGSISRVVPMVPHVDHSEHSVDVVVTERGLVDTRPLTPRQTAEAIISKCAHPDYKDLLKEYYDRAVKERGGHEPHLLQEAFSFHERHMATGHMRP